MSNFWDTSNGRSVSKDEFQLQVSRYQYCLSDIPMPEVMERTGYRGERQGEARAYRDGQGQVALRVEQQKMFDSRNQHVCRNSLDLVVHMRSLVPERGDP